MKNIEKKIRVIRYITFILESNWKFWIIIGEIFRSGLSNIDVVLYYWWFRSDIVCFCA